MNTIPPDEPGQGEQPPTDRAEDFGKVEFQPKPEPVPEKGDNSAAFTGCLIIAGIILLAIIGVCTM